MKKQSMQNSIKNLEQNWRHTAEVNYGFFILMIMFTKFYQLFTFLPPPLPCIPQILHHSRKTLPSKIFVWTPYNVLYSYDNTKASTKSFKGAYYFVLTILYYLTPYFPSLSPNHPKILPTKHLLLLLRLFNLMTK